MSILNDLAPAPAPNFAQLAADNIKRQTQQTFLTMVQAFNSGAKLFWQNSKATPAEISAALGADAREVFELHGKLGQLLASVKPEIIAATAAIIGQFEYNEDGTVTVLSDSNLP